MLSIPDNEEGNIYWKNNNFCPVWCRGLMTFEATFHVYGLRSGYMQLSQTYKRQARYFCFVSTRNLMQCTQCSSLVAAVVTLFLGDPMCTKQRLSGCFNLLSRNMFSEFIHITCTLHTKPLVKTQIHPPTHTHKCAPKHACIVLIFSVHHHQFTIF